MNLYLPVYNRLEDEVVALSNEVFFDDKQLDVYSLKIGDLLIRCVVEIEAISKEIYLRLGGQDDLLDSNGNKRRLYYDTDGIDLIVSKWDVDKKRLQITNPNMFFSSRKSVIIPLHKANKRGKSSSRWQRAYQAIKHNRTRSICMATVECLINALGALYILNLYYADEAFWVETPIKDRREYTIDSKIFTPFVCDACKTGMSIEMGDACIRELDKTALEESIYIKKITDAAFKHIHRLFCMADIRIHNEFKSLEEYKYCETIIQELNDISAAALSRVLNKDYYQLIGQQGRTLRDAFELLSHKEIILNKHKTIYPELTLDGYKESEEGKRLCRDLEKT